MKNPNCQINEASGFQQFFCMPCTLIDQIFSHFCAIDPAVSPTSNSLSHDRKKHGTVAAAPPNKEFHILQSMEHSPTEGILSPSISAFLSFLFQILFLGRTGALL